MDRLNRVHRASRVALPSSIVNFDQAAIARDRPRRLSPAMFQIVAIAGFTACSGFIIVLACLLALSIK